MYSYFYLQPFLRECEAVERSAPSHNQKVVLFATIILNTFLHLLSLIFKKHRIHSSLSHSCKFLSTNFVLFLFLYLHYVFMKFAVSVLKIGFIKYSVV